jgi:hypothetical protein
MVKLMAMAGALLSGSAVAMENETVNEAVTGTYEQVKQMVQQKLGVVTVDAVKEAGYPYPNETFLDGLTEDQEFAVISFIDQVNASYDFSSMTDEEIEAAIVEIKADLHDLYDELGIETPTVQERVRQGFGKRGSDAVPSGDQDGDCDLEETDTL